MLTIQKYGRTIQISYEMTAKTRIDPTAYALWQQSRAYARWLREPHYIGKHKMRGLERRGRTTIKPWR